NINTILNHFINAGINITESVIDKIQKYTLQNSLATQLSMRQEECLYYLLKGFTAKETGKILNLSHRTVEKYLNNLKDKFKCHKKTNLITKAIESGGNLLIPRNLIIKHYIRPQK